MRPALRPPNRPVDPGPGLQLLGVVSYYHEVTQKSSMQPGRPPPSVLQRLHVYGVPSEEHPVQRVDDGTAMIDGRTKTDELGELAGIALPEGDYDTVAGFVLEELGHVPRIGEQVHYDGLRITELTMDGLRTSNPRVVQVNPRRTELLSTLRHESA